MHLRVGIVEDSQENINTLRHLLGRADADIEIAGEAKTLDEARALLAKALDLALLDIQLKEGTIFEVLNEFHSANRRLPAIVFVTAHGSFENATKAIQFAALDFLTKPLALEDLNAVIDKVQKQHERTVPSADQVGFLLELLQSNMQAPRSIGIILSRGVIEFVELGDILYFQADENTCLVKTVDDNTLHSTRHLGYYISLLLDHPDFVQISKSCLVNLTHIKRYSHRDKSLQLKTGQTLIASHRFSKNLRKVLLESQKGLQQPGILRRLFGGSGL